jgi:hypothetical protein
VHAQHAMDVFEVGLDGVDRKVQHPGDLVVGMSVDEQAQDFSRSLSGSISSCPASLFGAVGVTCSELRAGASMLSRVLMLWRSECLPVWTQKHWT